MKKIIPLLYILLFFSASSYYSMNSGTSLFARYLPFAGQIYILKEALSIAKDGILGIYNKQDGIVSRGTVIEETDPILIQLRQDLELPETIKVSVSDEISPHGEFAHKNYVCLSRDGYELLQDSNGTELERDMVRETILHESNHIKNGDTNLANRFLKKLGGYLFATTVLFPLEIVAARRSTRLINSIVKTKKIGYPIQLSLLYIFAYIRSALGVAFTCKLDRMREAEADKLTLNDKLIELRLAHARVYDYQQFLGEDTEAPLFGLFRKHPFVSERMAYAQRRIELLEDQHPELREQITKHIEQHNKVMGQRKSEKDS